MSLWQVGPTPRPYQTGPLLPPEASSSPPLEAATPAGRRRRRRRLPFLTPPLRLIAAAAAAAGGLEWRPRPPRSLASGSPTEVHALPHPIFSRPIAKLWFDLGGFCLRGSGEEVVAGPEVDGAPDARGLRRRRLPARSDPRQANPRGALVRNYPRPIPSDKGSISARI